ncbi:MAG: EAL domain-containing protein [Chromatiales bacterium]|jgi:EAL domain-containing protein (putative c-di-GMP-specific phosphodiesterase class I)|nr:EAL domain-containing protein [Chromatiales bacterium]MDX9766883.1 EAL domain-containing protein [Ectothiorhodospiraceae bacterium]
MSALPSSHPTPDELASAVDAGLPLFYQPIFHTDGRAVAAEALLRWQPAGRDVVPPPRVVAEAERLGLAHRLLTGTLRRALGDVRRMPGWADDLRLSVNVTPRQVEHREFAADILDVLEAHETEPFTLWLEITERSRLDLDARHVRRLTLLHEKGVRIAIDDLGSGFASLEYLCRLPVSVVKIDRIFVERIGRCERHMRVLAGMAAIARDLGLVIVAEGVNTLEQVDFLADLGVTLLQGYALAPPAPPALFEMMSFRDMTPALFGGSPPGRAP